MIGGKYTHAVKKIAKKGDFRVQDDHGGKVEKYSPSQTEILFAEQCIENSPFSPIYARVDIIYDNKLIGHDYIIEFKNKSKKSTNY